MPSVEFDADDITTEDQLFDILKGLRAQGWRGQLSMASVDDDPTGAGWRFQVSKEPTTPGGLGLSMEAHIGDKSVVFNGVITVMTQADYSARYEVA